MALGDEVPSFYLCSGSIVSRHGVFTRDDDAAAQREHQSVVDCIFHRRYA